MVDGTDEEKAFLKVSLYGKTDRIEGIGLYPIRILIPYEWKY